MPYTTFDNNSRIIHNAHRIELKGDSVRKIYTNN